MKKEQKWKVKSFRKGDVKRWKGEKGLKKSFISDDEVAVKLLKQKWPSES